MKIIFYPNRTCVSFNIESKGNTHVRQVNKIHKLINKHNAQETLYSNKPAHITGKLPSGETGAAATMGNTGGTITFHEHSCNHRKAADQLVRLIKSFGTINYYQIKYFQEVTKTHRENGLPYKKPASFIEEIITLKNEDK